MIHPLTYIKKLEGKSNSHLITFSDGRDYVVKYFQPGFEKTLPNEWVAYCLARYLGLPIPYAQIVQIPEAFTEKNTEFSNNNISKYQFASLYIPNCLNGHQVVSLEKIINHESLAAIILFDYWLGNTDRTRKNILLQEQAPGMHYLRIIDHAEVFGTYNWVYEDLDQLPKRVMKSYTHQLMARFIGKEEDFAEPLELIQTIPILLIEEIVSLIPEDWNVSEEEKKGMVTILLRRRDKILRELMGSFLKKVYRPLHQQNDMSADQ